MTAQPTTRAFLPGDRTPQAAMRPLIRKLASEALCRLDSSLNMPDAATRLFGPEAAATITRAAVSPASLTSTPALAGSGEVATFLAYLAPSSAAAELLAMVPRISMDGMAEVSLPRWSVPFVEAPFVGESMPIPVLSAALEELVLGPPKKLASIATMTSELSDATGEMAEMVISEALKESAGRALDSALFSTVAGSSLRPPGLLASVSPTTAATGGGVGALASDLGALAGVLAANGGGRSVIYVANPRQAMVIKVHAPHVVVISSPSLPSGTIVALERDALITGFDGTPQISIVKDTSLHMENSAPLPLSSGGVLATPSRSMYQMSSLAIRCIQRVAWVRRPGLVAVVNSVTW